MNEGHGRLSLESSSNLMQDFGSSSDMGSFDGSSMAGGSGWVQPPLASLLQQPVVLLNWRSKRKMFAQSGKKPTLFETWAKGTGAGPELKTFKDNKWWLLPQVTSSGTQQTEITDLRLQSPQRKPQSLPI
jgi:hypothetical protein